MFAFNLILEKNATLFDFKECFGWERDFSFPLFGWYGRREIAAFSQFLHSHKTQFSHSHFSSSVTSTFSFQIFASVNNPDSH